MSAGSLNFELRAYVGDVETMFRVKSELHFAIFKRFKEEKFFDTPGPNATKVEIAGFEDLGKLLTPDSEVSASGQPKRGTAGR
jgi:potassium-dependent mechanosensitive channel